jgi:hypothetical protein
VRCGRLSDWWPPAGEVLVGIDTDRGPSVAALVAEYVVFAVNPRTHEALIWERSAVVLYSARTPLRPLHAIARLAVRQRPRSSDDHHLIARVGTRPRAIPLNLPSSLAELGQHRSDPPDDDFYVQSLRSERLYCGRDVANNACTSSK